MNFLGLYSYLMKLSTGLSDITLSTTLKLDFNSSSTALLKLTPWDSKINRFD